MVLSQSLGYLWLRVQDFVDKTLRLVRISLLISSIQRVLRFVSGKLFYKSNRKLFSCVCMAWYKHSRRWENSRQLCKPSTSSRNSTRVTCNMVVASRCFAFRALITQARIWKSFRVPNLFKTRQVYLFAHSFVSWNMENRYKEGESIFLRLSWHFKREKSVFWKASFSAQNKN